MVLLWTSGHSLAQPNDFAYLRRPCAVAAASEWPLRVMHNRLVSVPQCNVCRHNADFSSADPHAASRQSPEPDLPRLRINKNCYVRVDQTGVTSSCDDVAGAESLGRIKLCAEHRGNHAGM